MTYKCHGISRSLYGMSSQQPKPESQLLTAAQLLQAHCCEVHEPAKPVIALSEHWPAQHCLKLVSLALLQQLQGSHRERAGKPHSGAACQAAAAGI
jgi:hypothetical protein